MTAEVFNDVYIGGAWSTSTSVTMLDVIDPATEETYAQVPLGAPADVDRAVAAARAAQPGWAATTPDERAVVLLAFADELSKRNATLATTLTRENGSPVAETGHAGEHAAAQLRYYASLTSFVADEVRPFIGAPAESIVRKVPLGVAGLITPWNYPLGLVLTKLAPALMAGCTTVVKPAPETPLHVRPLVEAAEAAGLPPGVLNVVTGDGSTGAALVEHPDVDKIAFTGSTATGRLIGETCGRMLRPVTLELGGKSAAIVLDDADLDHFARSVVRLSLRNSGQTCYACTRVLVPRSHHRAVRDLIVDAIAAAPVGDPFDPATVFGPVVSAAQRERVERYVEIGRSEGARALLGGGRPRHLDRGYFLSPTVFDDVTPDMRIAQEEIFGPVLSVLAYDSVDDAVRIANHSRYGLGGAVFGADEDRAEAVAKRIETGNVGINFYSSNHAAPFSGRKESGVGVEFGPEGLAAYLTFQSVHRRAS